MDIIIAFRLRFWYTFFPYSSDIDDVFQRIVLRVYTYVHRSLTIIRLLTCEPYWIRLQYIPLFLFYILYTHIMNQNVHLPHYLASLSIFMNRNLRKFETKNSNSSTSGDSKYKIYDLLTPIAPSWYRTPVIFVAFSLTAVEYSYSCVGKSGGSFWSSNLYDMRFVRRKYFRHSHIFIYSFPGGSLKKNLDFFLHTTYRLSQHYYFDLITHFIELL